MNWQLFVRCKNAGCDIPGQQILLPYSTPVGTDVNPPPLPTDIFPARVVCRDCGHWYVYSRQDAEWGGMGGHPRLLGVVGPESWIVTIKCGVQDCDSLTKWHIREDTGLRGAEVAKLVLHATPDIVCERGHSLLLPDSIVYSVNTAA
jgi:hypothetical protein